jgi:hypothetical protein
MAFGLPLKTPVRGDDTCSAQKKEHGGLEPLAEVEGALLVVEVLHAPHPELGGLLLGLGEHLKPRGIPVNT